MLGMLHRILEKQEVNWQYLLSFLAVYLVCFQQASVAIQGMSTNLGLLAIQIMEAILDIETIQDMETVLGMSLVQGI